MGCSQPGGRQKLHPAGFSPAFGGAWTGVDSGFQPAGHSFRSSGFRDVGQVGLAGDPFIFKLAGGSKLRGLGGFQREKRVAQKHDETGSSRSNAENVQLHNSHEAAFRHAWRMQ